MVSEVTEGREVRPELDKRATSGFQVPKAIEALSVQWDAMAPKVPKEIRVLRDRKELKARRVREDRRDQWERQVLRAWEPRDRKGRLVELGLKVQKENRVRKEIKELRGILGRGATKEFRELAGFVVHRA